MNKILTRTCSDIRKFPIYLLSFKFYAFFFWTKLFLLVKNSIKVTDLLKNSMTNAQSQRKFFSDLVRIQLPIRLPWKFSSDGWADRADVLGKETDGNTKMREYSQQALGGISIRVFSEKVSVLFMQWILAFLGLWLMVIFYDVKILLGVIVSITICRSYNSPTTPLPNARLIQARRN